MWFYKSMFVRTTMGTKDSQPQQSSSNTSAQPESTGSHQTVQRKSQSTNTGYSGMTSGRAEQHFGVDISSRRQLNELQRLEQTHGRKVNDWLDEGMPREAMGTPDEMRAFRLAEGKAVSANDDTQNEQPVQRSTKTSQPDGTGLSLEIDPDPQLEREAEETAQRVMQSGGLGVQRLDKTGIHLQRMSMGSLSDMGSDLMSGVDDVMSTGSNLMGGGGGLGDVASMGSDLMGGGGGLGDVASIGSDLMGGGGGGLGDVASIGSDLMGGGGGGLGDVASMGSDLMGGGSGGLGDVASMGSDLMGGGSGGLGDAADMGTSAAGMSAMPTAPVTASPSTATPPTAEPEMDKSLRELLRSIGQ
jgi:hypothetical protein